MATNTYRIEYATTGRAKCKDSKCKQTIEKGALRIGKESPNPFSDDESDRMVTWYHAECMFNAMARMRAGTKKIESIDDIAGFDDLEDDDQEIVRALVEEAGKGGGAKKKGTKRKKAAAAPKKTTKKKPAKKAAAPSGDADYTVYLVADSVSGGKFWEAKQFGSTTAVRYGKVGANGSTSTKEHDDEEAARKFIDKTAKAKRKKGYEDAENEADEEEEEEEKKPAKKKKTTKKKAAKKKPEPESDEDEDMGDGGDRVVYLVADSVSGGKFWECTVSGSTVTTRYGKIDSDGQTTVKSFKDNAAAIKFADKKEKEKRKKGYEEE